MLVLQVSSCPVKCSLADPQAGYFFHNAGYFRYLRTHCCAAQHSMSLLGGIHSTDPQTPTLWSANCYPHRFQLSNLFFFLSWWILQYPPSRVWQYPDSSHLITSDLQCSSTSLQNNCVSIYAHSILSHSNSPGVYSLGTKHKALACTFPIRNIHFCGKRFSVAQRFATVCQCALMNTLPDHSLSVLSVQTSKSGL